MKIERILVVGSLGRDIIFLHTNIPDPLQNEKLVLKFETNLNEGYDFVKKYFNIEPEIFVSNKGQSK